MDIRTIKRSRSSFTGAITKVKDKLREMQSREPDTYNVRYLERALTSISNSDAGFQQTIDDIQEMMEDEEMAPSIDSEEEERAISTFAEHVDFAQDLAEDLLAAKRISLGTANLQRDTQAMRDTFTEDPTLNQDEALSAMNLTFSSIRRDIERSTLESGHHLQNEVDSLIPVINRLNADLTTSKLKTASARTPDLSTSMSSRDSEAEDTCRLPKLDIPTFHGDLMKWQSFWTQFVATVDSNFKLFDVRKMAYLRRAVKDPEVTELLSSGIEKPGLYQEKVAELKRRYDRVREIHRNYCIRLNQLADVKGN